MPAQGKLASADLAAATEAILYQVPAGEKAVVNLKLHNRGGTTRTVSAWVADSGVAVGQAADALFFEVSLGSKGVIDETGVILGDQQKIIVEADGVEVTAMALGYAEAV